MTKAKSFAIAALVSALAAGNAAAQGADANAGSGLRLSIGAGGLFASDIDGGFKGSRKTSSDTVSNTMKMRYSGGGAFGFLDMTYAELSLSYWSGGGEITSTSKSNGAGDSSSFDWSRSNLNIGLLGKYPIALSDKVSVFPLAGIDYMIALTAKDEYGDDMFEDSTEYSASDFSALWFKAGAGFDYRFSGGLYFRMEALYGLRLANTIETDYVDDYKNNKDFKDASAKSLLGNGFTVKAAIGYSFDSARNAQVTRTNVQSEVINTPPVVSNTPPVAANTQPAVTAAPPAGSGAKVAVSIDLFPFYKGMLYTDDKKDVDNGVYPKSLYALAPSIECLVAPHFSITGTLDMYFGKYEVPATGTDTKKIDTFYLGVTAHGRYYPLSTGLNGFFLDTGIGYNKLTVDDKKIFDGLFAALKAGYKIMPKSGFFIEPSISWALSKGGDGSIPIIPAGLQGGLAIGTALKD